MMKQTVVINKKIVNRILLPQQQQKEKNVFKLELTVALELS